MRDELGPVYLKFRLVTSPQGPAVREGCGPGLHPVEEGPAPQGRVVPMPCWGVQGLDRAGLNSSVLKPIHGPAPSPALGLGEGGHLRSPGEDPHPQQGRVSEHGVCGQGGKAPGLVIWLQRTSLYGQALQWEAWAEGPAGPGLPGHPPGAVGLAPKAGQRGGPGALTGAGRQSARPQSGPPRVLSAESRGQQAQGRSWW